MAIDAAERAKQQHYVEVVIVRCTKLRTRNGDAPKAYVGYKLFGYENVVTDVAEEGTDPTFDSEQALPIQINGQFMRTLRKEHLEMTVFDDLTRADGEPIAIVIFAILCFTTGCNEWSQPLQATTIAAKCTKLHEFCYSEIA